MRATLALLAAFIAGPVAADIVIAARTIRPEEVIAPADLVIKPGSLPGAYSDAEAVVGQEARVILYAGRPVFRGNLRPPALVGRNDIVTLVYHRNGLEITAEGRALTRAAAGERALALNTSSRARVSGIVTAQGHIVVQ